METDAAFHATGTARASRGPRLPYRSPKLSLFGDVGSLTETGSRTGMEDGFQNGMCANSILGMINTTFNMC